MSDRAFKRRRIPQRGAEGESPASAEVRPGAAEESTPPSREPARSWPGERASEPESGSFGVWLRRQREAREVGLREIAERTKISFRYLEAMENDRFDLLPAPVFARGFLREYARYVGLNTDEVMNHFLAAQGQSAQDELGSSAPTLSIPRSSNGASTQRWLFLGLATLALIGLVALGAWLADQRRNRPRETPPVAVPPVVRTPPRPAAAPATTPEAPARALRLALDFSGDCWVDAVLDGGRRVSEQRVQGESLQVEADRSIELTLGNAGAVEAQLNGLPLPLPRRLGEVARRTIDLSTARQLEAEKEPR